MKSGSYNTFRNRIHSAAGENNFPLRVMFELTYRCNFKCRHCYIPGAYARRYKNELKTKDIFFILEQLKESGCFYLGFTGGEPFIRPDIMAILKYAKRCGFEVIVYTNGSLIDEKAADEIASLGLNKVDITIPGISEGAFERVTGVRGAREKVFRAIELLRKKRIEIGFKTCILEANESEVGGIMKFAASSGAPLRLGDNLFRRLDGSSQPYRYKIKPLRNSEKRALKNCHCESRQGGTKQSNNLFRCGAGLTQAAITPRGELKLCVMIDYPKYIIPRISFKEAWRRLNALAQSIAPDNRYECDGCGLRGYCDWCPARAWLKDKTFTACDSESKSCAERKESEDASHRD